MPVLLVTIYHQILEQDIKSYNHYRWTETLAFPELVHESFDLLLEEPTNSSGSFSHSRKNFLSINVRFTENRMNAGNVSAVCVRASKVASLKVVFCNKYTLRDHHATSERTKKL